MSELHSTGVQAYTTDTVYMPKDSVVDSMDNNIGMDGITAERFRFPDTIKVIRSLPAKMIFAEKTKNISIENNSLVWQGKKFKKTVRVTLINYDDEDITLSYYDWALMEAIISSYLSGNADIPLDALQRVLRFDKSKGVSKAARQYDKDSDLLAGLDRLTKTYVLIDDDIYNFKSDGYLINGQIYENKRLKTILHVNEIPILFRHADYVSHINSYRLEAMRLPHRSMNAKTVAEYRFLIDEVTSRFSTPKKTDLINGKNQSRARKVSPILIPKICSKLYGHATFSNLQTVRNALGRILEDMVLLNYIDGYSLTGKTNRIMVYRDALTEPDEQLTE